MSRISPLPESEATDKVEQTYGRIKELLEVETVPEPFLIMGRVPAFLQDFYMNFKKFVIKEGKLDARAKSILGLAVSANANCGTWVDFFTTELKKNGGDDQLIADVLAVSATNTMYNVFFKFRDTSGSDLFSGMGVGLRAHTFRGTALDENTVELINLTLSNINACKPCTSGHVEKARKLEISDDMILEAVQLTAIVHSGSQFVNGVNC